MLEADFQREYQIDLVDRIDTMSWRKFVVLCNGLSGGSVYVVVTQNRRVPIDCSSPEDYKMADRIVNKYFGEKEKK